MTGFTQQTDGFSRRELLGRGVKLGGVVLWMTPAVQTFGMARAFATTTSGPCLVYCVKYEVDEGKWVSLGKGTGNCFICPQDALNGLPEGFNGQVKRIDDGKLSVDLSGTGCTVWGSVETGTADELTGNYSIAVKCGSQQPLGGDLTTDGSSACHMQTIRDPAKFVVHPCGNGKGVSHFEFMLNCCP